MFSRLQPPNPQPLSLSLTPRFAHSGVADHGINFDIIGPKNYNK